MMSINNPGPSSVCNQASSSTFSPSTFSSSTFPPSTFPPSTSGGHHQRLSSMMGDHFLPFEPSATESGSSQVSSVWNDASQTSSSRDWLNQTLGSRGNFSSSNQTLGSRGNFSSSLPSFTPNIYDQGVKESETESISDEEESFFSDYTDSDDEGEDEFKVRLRRLSRWMESDLSPIQQVVAILSLINRNKSLGPVSRSFIKSHINIFNRQDDESASSDEDQDPNIAAESDKLEETEKGGRRETDKGGRRETDKGGRRGERRFRKQEEEEREFDRKVQDANSLNFWQLYFNSRGNVPRNDELLDLLLLYLPLVHVDLHVDVDLHGNGNRVSWSHSPDVTPLNILYLHLISGVLSKVVSLKLQPPSSDLLSKSRSLLSIALISRCFTKEQKASLNSQFMTKLILQSHASNLLQSQPPSSDPRLFLRFSHPKLPPSDDSSTSSQQPNSFLPSLPSSSFTPSQPSSQAQSSSFSSQGQSSSFPSQEQSSSFTSSPPSSQGQSGRNSVFPSTDLSLTQSGQEQEHSGQLKNRLELSARPPLPTVSTGSKSGEQQRREEPERREPERREPFSGEGMSGVPSFLKTLRLHKYTDCFASLPSLSAFMNLSESDLETLGVAAKGARKKFSHHLDKLRSRPQTLSHLLLSPYPSLHSDILPGILSALSAGPLSKESRTEINLIIHLLLKVKSVQLTTEQNLQLIQTIDKCLQYPVRTTFSISWDFN